MLITINTTEPINQKIEFWILNCDFLNFLSTYALVKIDAIINIVDKTI